MRTYEIVVTEKYYSTKKNSLKLYKETDSMFLKEQSMTKQSGIDYRLAPNRLRNMYHMKINAIKQEQADVIKKIIEKQGKPGLVIEDDSAEIMPCIKLYYKSSVKKPKVIFEFEEIE